MDKLKKALSGESSDDQQGVFTDIANATKLSWSTRIKGFIICFVLGFVVSFLGSCLLFLGKNGLMLFAIFYTLGNILSLASTCFLMGPVNQIKKMFEKTRLIATILVFVCMALTLCAALWWKIGVLAIICCILQFLALTWYSLSYIPFARDAAKKMFSGCIG